MPRRESGEPIDWAKAVVHGVIGAMLGAGMGFGSAWLFWPHGVLASSLVGAMVVGLIAAVYGDRFWESIHLWLSFWP